MEKISIKSMIAATVVVNLPSINRRFEWPRKGTIVKVDREIFDTMMYDVGFGNMLKYGVLFIQDMDVKKEMGLEPEDATEPVNLIELDDNYIKRLCTLVPEQEFKATLKRLSETQRREIANYMVANSDSLTMARINIMKDVGGIDVEQGIKLKRANEEKVDEEG